MGPWPHPGSPYPIWSWHIAESKLRHPNQSFSSEWTKCAARHLPEGSGSSGREVLAGSAGGPQVGRFVLPVMTLRTLRTILIFGIGTSFPEGPRGPSVFKDGRRFRSPRSQRSEAADDQAGYGVTDLGSFHNEGEPLIAVGDRSAELLGWLELAQELTCRSGSHDRQVQQETPASFRS